EWYLNDNRPEVNVYAIAVNTADLSPDVVLEAINQRNLAFPVYVAAADILHGDSYRLFVVDNDRAVERFSTFDPAMLIAALNRLGIAVPEGGSVVAPEPAPGIAEPEPTPATAPEVVESITTTTTTVSEAEPSSISEPEPTSV